MMSAARLLVFGTLLLAGCRTARNVAVTTFHVVDAPAKYIRDRLDNGESTTTTTTTTTEVSDVSNPGQPVNSPPPKVAHHQTTTRSTSSSAESSKRTETTTPPRKSVTSAPRSSPAPTTFPTAKPVPGKPGYVYSIDPKGGIVDVTGYKPGDKAKDPYTKQIFIVP